ncbi:MAG TPA: pectinesterase family protein [Pseudonocardiaceae bacterium]|nr:pectinesterase family protein [Pseudonocardiaceae bacterium]
MIAGGAVRFLIPAVTLTALAGGVLAAPAHADASPASWPSDHRSGVCVDTPLRLTFTQPPVPGSSGAITVHRADGSVADRLDLADPADTLKNIGGALSDSGQPHEFRYSPVLVTGDTATITPHHELDPARTYYVTVDPGVFVGFPGITDPRAWRFRTRPATPPGDHHFVVAADGSGDFCTVQGAIDAVPAGNTHTVRIDVRPGTYTEIDYIRPDKPHITITGAGTDRTVIQYANNDRLNGDTALGSGGPADACPRRVLDVPDVHNCWRALFGVDADDVTISDLTLHNTTPYGGSQAEAFRGNGQRITLDRVTLTSFQDTLRLQGAGFVTDSMISGDVDFVWGTGTAFIQDSTPESTHAGYVTQIRNDATHNGDVFLRDRLTRAAGVADGSVYLGRIQTDRFPYSQAVYLDTAMDSHIVPVGWQITPDDCAAAPDLADWEYHSTNPLGAPVDTSGRLPCARQLTDATAARWSDPGFVLGGWVPTTVNADPAGDGRHWHVRWTATPGHSAADTIVACRLGSPVPPCWPLAATGTTADVGAATVGLPPLPGRYMFRYVTRSGAVLATSAPVVVPTVSHRPVSG